MSECLTFKEQTLMIKWPVAHISMVSKGVMVLMVKLIDKQHSDERNFSANQRRAFYLGIWVYCCGTVCFFLCMYFSGNQLYFLGLSYPHLWSVRLEIIDIRLVTRKILIFSDYPADSHVFDHMTFIFLHQPVYYGVLCLLYGVVW